MNQWGEGGRVTQPNKLEEMSLYHVILLESHMVYSSIKSPWKAGSKESWLALFYPMGPQNSLVHVNASGI